MEREAMLIEFKNKKLNIVKLLSFGFVEKNDCFLYSADLSGCRMKMYVTVSKDGKVGTKVLDGSGEEYVLHLVSGAEGSFVGQVRLEYENTLNKISQSCFDSEVFKSAQAKAVIKYINERYCDEPEFLWKRTPDNAIARRKDSKKWYIVLLTVSRRKLGICSDEKTEIICFRMKPEDIEVLVDNKKYFPGYHMNKKHWAAVCLDNTVADWEIFDRIDDSYRLAK